MGNRRPDEQWPSVRDVPSMNLWVRSLRTLRLKLGIVALVGSAVLGSGMLAPSTAEASGLGIARIGTNLCLDDTGWSKSPGTQMQLWPCTGGSNQDWYPVSTPWGGQLYKNAYSGLCLDLSQDSQNNFTPAIQWPCDTWDNAQIFYLAWNTHSGYNWGWAYRPNNGTSGNCLDDPYGRTAWGTKVEFYSCNWTLAQSWSFAVSY